MRAAVVDVAAVADGLADDGELDPQVGRALLTAATDLAARGRWRAGTAERAAVLEVVPRAAALVRARPDVVVPLLVASARTVERSADRAVLADLLAAAPPTDDVDDLRATVLVATWRAGAVPLPRRPRSRPPRAPGTAGRRGPRAAPGHAAGRRPRRAHRATRGGGRAAQSPGVLRRVGGFRGFGGPWLAVPRVSSGRCRPGAATSGPTGSAGPCWPTSTGAPSCGSTRPTCDAARCRAAPARPVGRRGHRVVRRRRRPARRRREPAALVLGRRGRVAA